MTTEGLAEKWFDDVIGKAKARANENENPHTRRIAVDTLKVLEANRDGLIALGEGQIMEFLGMIGRGERKKAQEFFIENTLDPDALIGGVADSADKIMDAPNTDWAKVALNIVNGLAETGAKIALTFLIGLI